MEIIGLVVEYNPFHNGHLYQIQEAKRRFPAAKILCVMSGNWVQRGEPALVDKWSRAEMALKGGADLVLELPTAFALQSAEKFAYGAVYSLVATGVVTHICFGSELGEVAPLRQVARLLLEEPPAFKLCIKAYLDQGYSYPKCLALAVSEHLATPEISRIVRTPNNILGIEYLRTLMEADSSIIPFTIRRKGTSHHCEDVAGSIASATAIRQSIKAGATATAYGALPKASIDIISREIQKGKAPIFRQHLGTSLLTLLRRSSLAYLYTLPDMEPGLPERFFRACRETTSLEAFLAAVATKRYTLPRLQRILCYLYLSLGKKELSAYNHGGVRYLRILGFSNSGRQVLRQMKEWATVPLIEKPARYFRQHTDDVGKRMLLLDIKGTDMHDLLCVEPAARKAGRDYVTSPIRI